MLRQIIPNSEYNVYWADVTQNFSYKGSQPRMTENRDESVYELSHSPDDITRFVLDTTLLDKSDFAMMTKLSSGETEPKSKKKPGNVVDMLMNRQQGEFSSNTKCNIYNRYIPNKFDVLDDYSGTILYSMFSKDGEYFITADEEGNFKIRNSGDGSYNIEKSMIANNIDEISIELNISSNNERFVYSSPTTYSVFLCKLADSNSEQLPLVLDKERFETSIYSMSFSADDRELLCGSSDGNVYIYDLECQRTTLKFPGHKYVNSVAFADDSSNVLYTAGNDSIVKLWDRRMAAESCHTPVGYLAGHRDEIMYMDLRGDNRHLITHSVDGSIKLWDTRVLSSPKFAEKWSKFFTDVVYNDISGEESLKESNEPLEGDTSIMTYRGHEVGRGRMTCRFSPVEITGQRFIYTGCASGKIVVYDALTGEAVQHQVDHDCYIWDVSWHPTRNEILSSGLDALVGIWTYRDPNTNAESEKIERDRINSSNEM